MNNRILLLILIVIVFYGCTRSNTPQPRKCYQDVTGFDLLTDTNLVFPLGTRNFWIYDDSLRRNEDSTIELINNNFLITARKLYRIDDQHSSIIFNQYLPQLTLINDTIYTTILAEQVNDSECFDYKPFLFRTATVAYLNPEKTILLYPASGTISTRLGNLQYHYIYENQGSLKYFLNTQLGIVRIEVKSVTGKLVRSKTLNNYYIE